MNHTTNVACTRFGFLWEYVELGSEESSGEEEDDRAGAEDGEVCGRRRTRRHCADVPQVQ